MMKKHNEGYTLVLVLVVMLVLTTVSIAIMSFSLRNLQNQQKSVERMQAKYAAQGEIERIVGQVTQDDEYAYSPGTETDETKKLQNMISAWIGENSDIQSVENIEINTESGNNAFSCEITVEKGNIATEIKLTGIITKKGANQNGKEIYTISNLEMEYKEYTYSTVTSTEGGNGQ